jgi:hypothetical protein
MVAEATETYRWLIIWLIIYVETYSGNVHLLVPYVYVKENRGSICGESRNLSCCHHIYACSVAHPAPWLKGSGCSFPGSKIVAVEAGKLTPLNNDNSENVDMCLLVPQRLSAWCLTAESQGGLNATVCARNTWACQLASLCASYFSSFFTYESTVAKIYCYSKLVPYVCGSDCKGSNVFDMESTSEHQFVG